MALQKSQSNDKLSQKVMSSSYHIEQKTFIEESCTNNVETGEKSFCSCHFLRFVGIFFRQNEKISGILRSARVFFAFLEVR